MFCFVQNTHVDLISYGPGPKILPKETQAGIYNNAPSHEESEGSWKHGSERDNVEANVDDEYGEKIH